MKKIAKSLFITTVLVFNTGCLNKEIKVKPLTEKEVLEINFNELKRDSNSTLYIGISKENHSVVLYTRKLATDNNSSEDNSTKGLENQIDRNKVSKNDEVHKIISKGHVSKNDEVCLRIDSKIKKVTVVGLNDDANVNIHKKGTEACIPLSQLKELDAYQLKIKHEDGRESSIHIKNEDSSKQKSLI